MVFGICKGKNKRKSVVFKFVLLFLRVSLWLQVFISQFVFGCLFIFEFFFKDFSDQLFFKLLFLGFVHFIDFLDLKVLEST